MIRAANNNDRQAIEELVFSVLSDYGLKADPATTDADLKDIEGNYLNNGGLFDVYLNPANQIIGTVGLYPMKSGLCELRKMYLHPGERGKGMGKKLLEHALNKAKEVGFKDPRLVSEGPIELDEDVKELTGNARFVSRTYRLFKLPCLENNCEDYGEVAVYKGTIKQSRHLFTLDQHHSFETGRPERVCGNTADMLQLSRFKEHFEIHGNRNTHFGEFICGNTMATDQYSQQESGELCC